MEKCQKSETNRFKQQQDAADKKAAEDVALSADAPPQLLREVIREVCHDEIQKDVFGADGDEEMVGPATTSPIEGDKAQLFCNAVTGEPKAKRKRKRKPKWPPQQYDAYTVESPATRPYRGTYPQTWPKNVRSPPGGAGHNYKQPYVDKSYKIWCRAPWKAHQRWTPPRTYGSLDARDRKAKGTGKGTGK